MPPMCEVKIFVHLVFLFLSTHPFSVWQKAVGEVLDSSGNILDMAHPISAILYFLPYPRCFPVITGCYVSWLCPANVICHSGYWIISFLAVTGAITVLCSVPLWPTDNITSPFFHKLGISSFCSVNVCFPEILLNLLLCGHHLAMPSMCRPIRKLKWNSSLYPQYWTYNVK